MNPALRYLSAIRRGLYPATLHTQSPHFISVAVGMSSIETMQEMIDAGICEQHKNFTQHFWDSKVRHAFIINMLLRNGAASTLEPSGRYIHHQAIRQFVKEAGFETSWLRTHLASCHPSRLVDGVDDITDSKPFVITSMIELEHFHLQAGEAFFE